MILFILGVPRDGGAAQHARVGLLRRPRGPPRHAGHIYIYVYIYIYIGHIYIYIYIYTYVYMKMIK